MVVAVNRLYNEQVGHGCALDVVDVGGLEQCVDVGRVLHRNNRLAHAIGEVGKGGLGAVEVAVVVRREKVAVSRVADIPHVNPVAASDVVTDYCGHAAVEGLGGGPASRVGDVLVSRVRGVVVLEYEVPHLLWSEEEDLRGRTVACANARLVEVVEGCATGLRKIRKIQIDETVAGRHCGTGKHVVPAVVENDRRILNS